MKKPENYDLCAMNLNRANWAQTALEAFAEEVGQDMETEVESVIGDLLGDLMHFCKQTSLTREVPIDFDECLRLARTYFADESKDGSC